ncbi:family 1 encapsulin nanocompartment shell protein [Alkaliphilus peptidifermentans]|uniref:Type 1 encapsulin shell protein n=1 Tax=Alkaliphilus peptidifermentans DSM 18978 TaxID=1120976 RepID=A0A1G5CIJ9_9FIRM|nr:family 1 encapsulin nanocompartment shell protein [Alkaliphilus peptidifermentans]SCY02111.1 Uncharacterized protein, linocin/CFP29 family [Alkaliphilus peptidifermentans DSM 18978]
MEYLLRDDSPFSHEVWDEIDKMVVKVASEQLVGRRFLSIYGPLGSGVQSIAFDQINYQEKGEIDLFGDEESYEISPENRKFVALPMIYKDLIISWRDVEYSKQFHMPLDLSTIAAATAACSMKEDYLIFNGSKEFSSKGLLNAEDRQIIKKEDWKIGENPFKDVAKGLQQLIGKGVYGSCALITSPQLYVQMQRIQEGTGILELNRVKELIDGRVYQSPVITENKAVLVAMGPQNMDLVIGQDMVTGYIGPEQLNHKMRVMETLTFRIKRPEAIVTFE